MKTALSILAVIFGIFLAVCEVIGTYEFLLMDQGKLTYVVFAGCGIAAAAALLPAWASYAWDHRPDLSIALWTLFVCALAAVVAAAIARTGAGTDLAQDNRTKATDTRALADGAQRIAQEAVNEANKALAAARKAVTDNAASKTCVANCADLLTTNVKSAEQALDKANDRLDAATAKIAAAPPARVDGFARRIAALLPFVDEDAVRLYQPVVVPFLTSALSAVLLALGISSLLHHRPAPAPAAPEPTEEPDVEETPLELEAEQPQRKPLQLQFVGPGAELAGFAYNCIEQEPGTELSMRDVLVAYEAYCQDEDTEPLDRTAFVRELASLCQRTGIAVRVEGKDAFLVGARLAA